MEDRSRKISELISLLERHAVREGLNSTSIDNLFLGRATQPDPLQPQIYPPSIVIGAQGRKVVYLEGKRYEYGAGKMMALFVPMVVACEGVEASPEKPMLTAIITIDLNRITEMILNMERLAPSPIKPDTDDASAIFSAPIKDNLLDAVIRLLRTLDNPGEAAILGQSIIDEIYFRILSEEQGGRFRYLLQQRGQIQQIARAVEYIHQNLDKPVSVDELADIVNMSSSGFYKKFKQVMYVSPLQYAKAVKLNRAQAYIMDGKSVTEASSMVGYNNLAQFSREYKRYFGILPSATRMQYEANRKPSIPTASLRRLRRQSSIVNRKS
ncbi:MAG: AraC family transcriptional regulator [Chloroflexi bacterium]|nr:MAG: AraC family transcriptional regulator [Chloroflexota bacterium]